LMMRVEFSVIDRDWRSCRDDCGDIFALFIWPWWRA